MIHACGPKTAPTWIVSNPFRLVCIVWFLTIFCGCGGSKDPIELFQNGEYEASFRVFSAQAASGDLVASNYLGMHYYLGAGVARDFVRAAELFEVAALAEYADAQRNLGVMYLRGLGVKQDHHQAYGWFFAAHAGGNMGAKEYLNLMVDNVTPNASGIARDNIRQQIEAHAAATSSPVSTKAKSGVEQRPEADVTGAP